MQKPQYITSENDLRRKRKHFHAMEVEGPNLFCKVKLFPFQSVHSQTAQTNSKSSKDDAFQIRIQKTILKIWKLWPQNFIFWGKVREKSVSTWRVDRKCIDYRTWSRNRKIHEISKINVLVLRKLSICVFVLLAIWLSITSALLLLKTMRHEALNCWCASSDEPQDSHSGVDVCGCKHCCHLRVFSFLTVPKVLHGFPNIPLICRASSNKMYGVYFVLSTNLCRSYGIRTGYSTSGSTSCKKRL